MTAVGELGDRAVDALLALAQERAWAAISLRDLAERAGMSLAELFEAAESKDAIVGLLSRRLDRGALATDWNPETEVHDRLFDAMMGRVEAMEPHRAVLVAIARSRPFAVAAHIPRTARAILESAGVEPSAARLAAVAAVWARVAQVWRDDEGALNRTMAEIDLRLKAMRRRLARVGQDF